MPMTSILPRLAGLQGFWPKAITPTKTDYELVATIHDAATRLKKIPDSALAQQTAELRQIASKRTIAFNDEVLVPFFALSIEAARRVLAIDLYDVQLLGGLALARGTIAEMQTGEGKTFAALLPTGFFALAGEGVHVMTTNAYLAQRDFEQLAPVYQLLNLSVGLADVKSDPTSKRAAYACDITFGPGYEFGFDYLRDQVALISKLKPRLGESLLGRLQGRSFDNPQPMQRGHATAIVDEADSVMIDEATTPLILSAGGNDQAAKTEVFQRALETAAQLEIDFHFVVDQAVARLQLTRKGLKELEASHNQVPSCGLDRPWSVYVEQALHAARHVRKNVDYIVRDGEVQLVDQSTGRIFSDRAWRDGLQQAVQAKEGVTITTENLPIARITRQRYLRLYKHLCGMTGTTQGIERELREVYGTAVIKIPTHKPCLRKTIPTREFIDRTSKEQAIVKEIARIHRTRQPVLVGTASIETSERLAGFLDQLGLCYELLNGKQDAEESNIVARAGTPSSITIATNMAGRGTDIQLERDAVQLGGLHVLVTEPQDSTRVDYQLVGRAARQGDPGSCQLFASADDRLFSHHAPALSRTFVQSANLDGQLSTTHPIAEKIGKIQRQVERARIRHRREMFAHDDWLESVLHDLTSSSSRSSSSGTATDG